MAPIYANLLFSSLFPSRCISCDAICGDLIFCDFCNSTIRVSAHAAAGGVSSGFHYAAAIRNAMLRIKFTPCEQSGRSLLRYWQQHHSENFTAALHPQGISAVCFVPLHWRRRLTRGFDLSSLFARALGRALQLPVLDVLQCTRFDPPLSLALSKQDRLLRTQNRYRLTDSSFSPAEVLLVDDICTTGATLDSAAIPLLEHGIRVRKYALAQALIKEKSHDTI